MKKARKLIFLSAISSLICSFAAADTRSSTNTETQNSQTNNNGHWTSHNYDQWTLQGNFGIARSLSSGQKFESELNRRGHNLQVTDANRTELGGYILLGYQWNHFGMQAGYAELGSYTTEFRGSTANLNQLQQDVSDIQPIGGSGIALLVNAQYDLDSSFRLQGKLGGIYLFGNDVELVLNGQQINTSSESELAPTVALGLYYKLDQQHGIGAEALHVDIDRNGITLYSVGYQYAF